MLLWLSCLFAGLCFCLVLYLALVPTLSRKRAPAVFSGRYVLIFLWPWIRALGGAVHPLLSWKYRKRLHSLIGYAGFSRVLTVEHLAGIQGVSGMLGILLGGVLSYWIFGFLGGSGMLLAMGGGAFGLGAPWLWVKERARKRQSGILRDLPFFLDMTTLCVEAGQNLQGALSHAAALGPPCVFREELRFSLNEMRTGRPKVDALRAMAVRIGTAEVNQFVSSIAQAESMGMGLGPLLRSQSRQRRQERFHRAEKLALEAPVKMLFPLVFCIFPCTFIVLAFPIAMKIIDAGG